MSEAGTEQAEETKIRRRVRQVGIVASISGIKSVVVTVERRVKHPKYHKFISRRTKFMAHDEREECGVGDTVELVSSRPLSARKRWRISKVLTKAVIVESGKAQAGKGSSS